VVINAFLFPLAYHGFITYLNNDAFVDRCYIYHICVESVRDETAVLWTDLFAFYYIKDDLLIHDELHVEVANLVVDMYVVLI